MRMRGYDVLHPMGWDAFGLPTENAAIETGRHPADLTREWSANYKRQLDLAGGSYDWAREINSTHPDYYRWTQWMFLKLYERGLAYRATGLAVVVPHLRRAGQRRGQRRRHRLARPHRHHAA